MFYYILLFASNFYGDEGKAFFYSCQIFAYFFTVHAYNRSKT
jgi:hypothetical protein